MKKPMNCGLRWDPAHIVPLVIALLLQLNAGSVHAATCDLEYKLPADLPPGINTPNNADDADFMEFSWQHFLALNAPAVDGQISLTGDNSTQWSGWSSTADLYDAAHPGPSGSRFYPAACREIPGYWKYRVLQQVGKVDDAFLEATTEGLSDDPVIDVDGNFLRYEILYSPAMYQEVVHKKLYKQSRLLDLNKAVNLSCGIGSYKGGDPANPKMGAMMLKVAWRDASGFSPEQRAKFHTEDLLVFSPGYRQSTGKNTCELKPMAMVGVHIGHKTRKQPVWIWATFEHKDNAPDCLSQSPAPASPGGAGTNKSCPEVATDASYSFFPTSCPDGGACASCNTAPAPNGAPGQCDNPLDSDGDGWCLDLPPNPVAGTSRLCRQVPAFVCSNDVSVSCSSDSDCGGGTCGPSYPAVPQQNAACEDAIANAGGSNSVWLNYELIGSQWVAEQFWVPGQLKECENAVASVITEPDDPQSLGNVINENLRELVALNDDASIKRPLLGNSSMESYDRANCLGCHAKSYMGNFCENDRNLQCSKDSDCSSVDGECTLYSFSTDFVYSLKLEVGQPPGLRLPGTWLWYLDAHSGGRYTPYVAWDMRSQDTLLGLTNSANDPRCNGARWGTSKAYVGFSRDGMGFEDPEYIELPCQGWHLRGDPANPQGYEYRDFARLWGPCQQVSINADRGVSARCFGVGVPEDLANADESLSIVLKTGSLRYCAEFASIRELGRHIAVSRRNEPPELCKLW
ncbi:MAG: hypothetical protein WBG92_24850 [Thiohalocapsa sp.]